VSRTFATIKRQCGEYMEPSSIQLHSLIRKHRNKPNLSFVCKRHSIKCSVLFVLRIKCINWTHTGDMAVRVFHNQSY
jgi:hypothetical protein